MEFTPSRGYSLGVEIEFQILDGTRYDLVPFAPLLLENAPKILLPRLSLEFIKSILEIQTGVCDDLRDVENDLLQTCSMAEELATDNDFVLFAASLHPFALAADQELSEVDRYARIMAELQIIGRRFISQGLHVHVGMPDGDTAVRTANLIQAFLPVFLALSTSSPFYEGTDTGLMSYRTKLFESLPLAGQYSFFEDWDHFAAEVADLIQHGVIASFRDLWWDARPNPEFGTIEVRACDLPTRFADILALVALIQATAAWLAESDLSAAPLRPYLLKANKWQAVRYGLDGRFIDPTTLLSDEVTDLRRAALLLAERVAPLAVRLEAARYFAAVESIAKRGTGALHMRRIHRESGDWRAVIRETQRYFWE